MKQKNNKRLAKEWFNIGKEELNFAQASFKELDAFYSQVCFLCHQAVEKYLKGFLVYHKGRFPKIHDLIELLKLCGKIDKEFLNFLEEIAILDQYYLVTRYPLAYPPAKKEQAKEALEVVEKIVNFINQRIEE